MKDGIYTYTRRRISITFEGTRHVYQTFFDNEVSADINTRYDTD